MAEQLYTMAAVAREIGLSFSAVRGRWERGNAPKADFYHAMTNDRQVPLWTEEGIELWRALVSDKPRDPRYRGLRGRGLEPMPATFSDHNAVNHIGSVSISWRLWWKREDNPTVTTWWFSTPNGWYTSDTFGRRWVFTGLMQRPAGHYHPLNNPRRKGMPPGAVVAHQAAQALQRRIEANMQTVSA